MSVANTTVLTPSIEGREALLAEAVESVLAQTLPAYAHLVWLDTEREGPAVCRNRLLAEVETEYVAFLDDDDVLYPRHLEVLANAIGDADLAFSWHDDGPDVPRFDEFGEDAADLMFSGRNVIPITVLARTDAILRVGGFDSGDRWEDYSAWLRMLHAGALFVCVPEVTWHYRISENGRTWNP